MLENCFLFGEIQYSNKIIMTSLIKVQSQEMAINKQLPPNTSKH